MCVFVFRRIFVFGIEFGFLGLKKPQTAGKRNPHETRSSSRRRLRGSQNTCVCAKFQGLSPKNDVNIWVCVQKNMGILHVPGNDLVSVYDTIFWR